MYRYGAVVGAGGVLGGREEQPHLKGAQVCLAVSLMLVPYRPIQMKMVFLACSCSHERRTFIKKKSN